MALEIPGVLSNEEACRQATLIKALADANRLRILHILRQHGGTIPVDKIVEQFEVEQPTISHHLRILLQAGLVNYKKSGMHIYYYIETSKVAEAYRHIRGLAPQKGQAAQ